MNLLTVIYGGQPLVSFERHCEKEQRKNSRLVEGGRSAKVDTLLHLSSPLLSLILPAWLLKSRPVLSWLSKPLTALLFKLNHGFNQAGLPTEWNQAPRSQCWANRLSHLEPTHTHTFRDPPQTPHADTHSHSGGRRTDLNIHFLSCEIYRSQKW